MITIIITTIYLGHPRTFSVCFFGFARNQLQVTTSRASLFIILAKMAKNVGEISKYSLNFRHVKQKQQPKRPPLGAPFGFNDDEDNDVEREVTLQGSKKKTLKDVEE
ncbi:hypothetical protein S83_067379 [Arachis hypogaea]